jgi:hypothetical protein
MKTEEEKEMPDEIVADEIDKAEALLAEADSPTHDDAGSLSLSAQAIGLLLLYFAKDHRDAAKKIEEMIVQKTERRLAELDEWLRVVMNAMPGGK